jgi:hypothetical protein
MVVGEAPGSEPGEAGARRLLVGLVLSVALAVVACDGSSPSEPAPREAVFLVLSSAASGETFHVLIRDPRVIGEAEFLVGRGNRKVVSGDLRRGDGGFNQPWSWHLVPESVSFADATIELCDGRPSFIESDLDYWIDTVGSFCPWGTEVVRRVR